MKLAVGKNFQNINLEDRTFIDYATGQSLRLDDIARKKMRVELELRQSSVRLPQVNRSLGESRVENSHQVKPLSYKFRAFIGSDFSLIENRLKEIESYEEQDDFTCKASDFAKKFVEDVIKEAYSQTPNINVVPLIAADGDGGLKFDWRKDDKEVRISIPANSGLTPYIYFQGETDDIIDNPNAQVLSEKLTWLNS